MITAALIIGFTIFGGWAALLRHEILSTGYLPRGTVLLLLIILLGNAALGRIFPKGTLTVREILFIYASLISVAAVSGQEFGIHFYLNLIGLIYYSSPQSTWAGLWNDWIPPWLVPARHYRDPAVLWAFEGMPEGARPPLEAWSLPLVLWTPYLWSIYAMAICLCWFFARHWAEKERLVYPLAQVPEDLAKADERATPVIFRRPVFWLGLLLGALPYSLRALHLYYPMVPDPRLQRTLEQWFGLPPGAPFFSGGAFSAFNFLGAHIYPEMIGIAYLLAGEVGLSFWSFVFFRQLEVAIRIACGCDLLHSEFLTYQSVGAYTVMAMVLVFLLLRGWKRRPVGQESVAEGTFRPLILPIIGLVPVVITILCWGRFAAGVSLLWLSAWLVGLMVALTIVGRVVAESGLFIYSSPFRVYQVLFDLFGKERIGGRNLVLLTAMSWVQARSTATLVSGYLVNAFRLSDRADLPEGSFVLWLLVCFLLALVTCHFAIPRVIYAYGIPKLSWWARGAAAGTANLIGGYLTTRRPPTVHHGAGFLMGCLLTFLLVQARLRWVNFPFHPLGFVACQGWPIDRYWLSIFLGWSSQRIVIRAGGQSLWSRLRPLAYGLITGGTAGLSLWILIRLRWSTADSIITD
ncbi:MAG: hypothetical protein NZ959_01750 [Armatimonadetes bacterium]|nr:hypothetical protein [Armatimonadota bacterium]MDW8121385.1 DUF6785 family protein [Armatimonadota bacterium]